MTKLVTSALVLVLVLVGVGCGGSQAPSYTSTPTAAPEPTPTATLVPEPTAEPTPMTTPIPQATATPTEMPLRNVIAVEESTVGDWTTYDAPELKYINIIKRDEAGRMWIATDGLGLTMFDGEHWHNWSQETREDMRNDAFRGLAASGDKVYVAARSSAAGGGLMIYDLRQDTWSDFWPEDSDLSSGGASSLAIDREGRVWFTTAYGTLDVYGDGEWEHRNIDPLPSCYLLSARDGLFDADGNYWLATTTFGVWKYDGTSWATHGPSLPDFEEGCAEDPPRAKYSTGLTLIHDNHIAYFSGDIPTADGCPARTNALAFDRQGQLWVATAAGLAVMDLKGAWHVYSEDNSPLLDVDVEDVAVDLAGRVWAVSRDQLAVFSAGEWQIFAPDTVGAASWGNAIEFDELGRAWVATGSGGIAVFAGEPNVGVPDLT